jgi:hypothetical protein
MGAAVLLMKFFFDHFGFSSGGAIGAIIMGLVVKECWHRRWPAILAGDYPDILLSIYPDILLSTLAGDYPIIHTCR